MSNRASLQRLWSSLQANQHLSQADRQALLSLPFTCRTLAAGDAIGRADDRIRFCTILISGFAYCSKILPDGARQIVSVHVPGDFFGLNNLFQPHNGHETRMLTPGEVASITAHALETAIRANPNLQGALWRQTAVEAAMFSEWLTNIGRRDAQGRIAHLLCEFAVRLRATQAPERTRFELPMTQAQLADTAGLTAVHVNRVLQSLRQAGLVALDKRKITINDWERLAKMADFDPAYLQSERAT